MTKYKRMSEALATRHKTNEAAFNELKDAVFRLQESIQDELEPPRKEFVSLHAFSNRNGETNANIAKLVENHLAESLCAWTVYFQLRIHLSPPGRAEASVTTYALISAQYSDSRILFTRVDEYKKPIGDAMSLEDFVTDCIDGEIEAIEADPRKQQSRITMGFIENS